MLLFFLSTLGGLFFLFPGAHYASLPAHNRLMHLCTEEAQKARAGRKEMVWGLSLLDVDGMREGEGIVACAYYTTTPYGPPPTKKEGPNAQYMWLLLSLSAHHHFPGCPL